MLKHCDRNLHFQYVATDSWFSSVENMKWVKEELKRNFVMALKSNRKVALSQESKQKKEYVKSNRYSRDSKPWRFGFQSWIIRCR